MRIQWKFEHVQWAARINGHPGREKGALLGWLWALKYSLNTDQGITSNEWHLQNLRQKAQRSNPKRQEDLLISDYWAPSSEKHVEATRLIVLACSAQCSRLYSMPHTADTRISFQAFKLCSLVLTPLQPMYVYSAWTIPPPWTCPYIQCPLGMELSRQCSHAGIFEDCGAKNSSQVCHKLEMCI